MCSSDLQETSFEGTDPRTSLRPQTQNGARAPSPRASPQPPILRHTPSPQPPPSKAPFGGFQWIDLRKPDPKASFGFSIGGGSGNQLHPGDNGIYVTKLIENGVAWQDGRLQMGDKLLAVRCLRPSGEEVEINMENRTHEYAVDVLRGAGAVVRLLIHKTGEEGLDLSGATPAAANVPDAAAGGHRLRQFQERPRKRKESSGLCCC